MLNNILDGFRPTKHLPSKTLLGKADFASGLGDSAWVLYGLTRALKPLVCVEIGSAQGKSACYIAAALEENERGQLFAIDPHTETKWNDVSSVNSYQLMRNNLLRLGLIHRVDILRDFSTNVAKAWDKEVDLLFIDGDHSYEGVKRDWNHFAPHVSKFGIVIFHDTIWEVGKVDEKYRRTDMGVPRFVEELRKAGYPVLTLPGDYGVSLVQPTLGGVPLQASL